ELEGKKETTDKKLAHAEKMYDEAEKLRLEFNAKVENENRKAEQKAQELLERARASADYVFDQLQELQRQKDAEDFKKKLEETRENVRQSLGMVSKDMKIADKIEVEYTPPREYKVGDTVILADFGKDGIIVSIDGENVVVTMGSAKIKTTNKKIRLSEKTEDKKSKSTHTPRKMMDVKSEIDVRGFICDDAIFVIDKFIDDAVMSSLQTIRIIHGKGTGALRKGLWDYFRHDKRISSFRMGSFGEGDAGVTVLTLK
ncbi:MAG: Smr/MutS family protein, partial [Clostridia bacterium]|nr:Smr/MutS family protein [Clostridia bacterium]